MSDQPYRPNSGPQSSPQGPNSAMSRPGQPGSGVKTGTPPPAAQPNGTRPTPSGGTAASNGAQVRPGFSAPSGPRPAAKPTQPAQPVQSGGGTVPAARPPAKGVRKAHLTLSRVEPWSVMKFSFVISLVCFIILFVAVVVIYLILSGLGVFDALIDTLTQLGNEDGGTDFDPSSWFSPGTILGYSGLIGALNVILITALCTVGAMLYNIAADLVGGVDMTLSETD
ncbi:DUF3566 domain-containing protein [Allonocardiopsis opalescens]|uniref:Transmembrane protein DUF3566 n=1 Tax=Allonocardiopsis opalescens TaxID=1144618 RepID=A0A2T0Q6Z3_9ACTN|nr:DUF3566 domain-containing protein [Allonocardiopsis opalescens]PRX99582.1 transmembrane protein DUF3566 [Allonocardiopsis opalescens]